MKGDQRRVSEIIKRTVVELCKTGLLADTIQIRGVIGITVNESEVFLVHINEDVEELDERSQEFCDENLNKSSIPNPSVSNHSQSAFAAHSTSLCSSRDVKKRLVFPVTASAIAEYRTESSIDNGNSLPDLTTVCDVTKSDESFGNYDDDALVIMDSEEEDDCIIGDPGVSSLCIASVVGSGGRSSQFQTCKDEKISQVSPSVKHESAQKAFIKPAGISVDSSILRSHSNGVLSYPGCQKSDVSFENQTPPKVNHVFGTPSRFSSLRRTPSQSMSQISLTSPISLPNSVTKSRLSRSRSTSQSAVAKPLFRTMFVCNIGRCSRGFAYKQVLVRHQQQVHQSAR